MHDALQCISGDECPSPKELAKGTLDEFYKEISPYTHMDKEGIFWRMNGLKPISEISDRAMEKVEIPDDSEVS